MTEHPFTNLPEGAEVTKDGDNWIIENGNIAVWVEPIDDGQWDATFDHYNTYYSAPTPDAAFQALRQAVKELANDLGVG